MSEPKISYEELMKELDKHRGNKPSHIIVITKEQRQFILKCRDHKEPVTWMNMCALWERLGWGKMRPTSLRNRYEKIKSGEL